MQRLEKVEQVEARLRFVLVVRGVIILAPTSHGLVYIASLFYFSTDVHFSSFVAYKQQTESEMFPAWAASTPYTYTRTQSSLT